MTVFQKGLSGQVATCPDIFQTGRPDYAPPLRGPFANGPYGLSLIAGIDPTGRMPAALPPYAYARAALQ